MKKRVLFSGRLVAAFLVVVIMASVCLPVYGFSPHTDYTYGRRTGGAARAVPSPNAFETEKVVGTYAGKDLTDPTDIVYGADENLYLLDAGNDRILVLDKQLELIRVIEGFINEQQAPDTFKDANGLFVDKNLRIFICDTERKRMICLNQDGSVYKIYEKPAGVDATQQDRVFEFKPLQVAVDQAGRIFIVNQGTMEGLVCMSPDGEFDGFIGANRVSLTPWELFWRTFATAEQRLKMDRAIPTSMNSLTIDSEGFLYAAAKAEGSSQFVRKFNLNGIDILKTDRTQGDMSDTIGMIPGRTPSYFVNIAVYGYGIFTCLDMTRGHLFTYTDTGDILFISGGMTAQEGAFVNPRALTWMDDSLLVIDRQFGEITKMNLTEYGGLMIGAVKAQSIGDYDDATEKWKRVLELNLNNELAYSGVGKALKKEKNYEEAMDHAKLSGDREIYTQAFELNRRIVIEKVMPWIFVTIGILVLIWFIRTILKQIKRYKDFLEGRNREWHT